MALLQCIEVESGENPQASVIWLHGLGADGSDFEPMVPQLGLPPKLAVRFVFPHAPRRPITVNGGFVMNAWYDIAALGAAARQDETGVRDSAALISELIQRENQRGIPCNRIVLGGFSQGGAMSLFRGLSYPEKLAGIVALSAYLPVEDIALAELRKENLAIPLFMGHGTYDDMVPYEMGRHARKRLKQKGMNIEWHDYPIAHNVSLEEFKHLGQWLSKTLL